MWQARPYPPVLTATSFHRHFPRGWAQSEKAGLGSTILTLQMKELQVRELSSNKFIGDP